MSEPSFVRRAQLIAGALALVAILATLALHQMFGLPGAAVGLIGIAVAGLSASRVLARRIESISEARAGEDYVSFANSFDADRVDPRIVLAVYEALKPWYSTGISSVAARASDRLDEDLSVTPADLDRVARDVIDAIDPTSVSEFESQRLTPVRTVRDLVEVLSVPVVN